MARRTAPPAVQPSPAQSLEVSSGLAAISTFGDTEEELAIQADGQFFVEEFFTKNIYSSEENISFIKKIESIVRSSREYKIYISHLRNDLNMNRCSFLGNIDTTTDEVSLEMHHCPLTLFDIVDIVLS